MKTLTIEKSFLLFCVLYFAALIFIKPWESIFSDQLLKFHQSYSMLKSGFSSENLIYPSLDIDPNYDYFLWKAPMVFRIGERMIGQYPIFLTLLVAPVLVFGWIPIVSIYLGTMNLISAYILKRFWNLSFFWILFAFFGTYIFLMGPELSEHPPLLLLELSGLTFFFRSRENRLNGSIAGLLLGIGVWLRLELIVFYALFWGAGWVVYGKDWWKKSFWTSIAFSATVLALLLFHTLDYQHPIGPRYFQNFNTGKNEGTVWERAFNILLGEYSMPGLLLCLPVLIPLLILLLDKGLRQRIRREFLHLAIVAYSFCLLIAFLAPNDGVSNWGPRYVGLALFPFVLTLHEIWTVSGWKWKESKTNIIFSIFIIYSFVMTVAGVVQYKKTAKEMRSIRSLYHSNEYRTSGVSTYLFLDEMLCGSSGQIYFQKRVLCVQDESDGAKMDRLLGEISKEEKGTKVAFISYGDGIKEYAAKLPKTDHRAMNEYREKVLSEAERKPLWLDRMNRLWKQGEIEKKGLWEYREYEIPEESK
ncbi:hypothetical protein EHQ27_14690 [Leptospira wolffii]|uniref:LA_3751/LA_3752 family putative glycosyltransferase n=1 Tax=Leptospira wolffii TaxID=409998 RepID=UPI0010828B3A|nr:hypothetical protein [Leptospira wolffii]TGK62282.1 hypothetical protein EHQ32_05510 [Leptospira wolffii]TGK68201.1 hypothetical protein EHQ27_14690 [Leptospira wolffii]TGK74334.1 hypothetical protein EHQ35_08265 [Leptospira wolffii]TGL32091.1 hypothetical protein EHQ57_04410 [Leptospira wolffii]